MVECCGRSDGTCWRCPTKPWPEPEDDFGYITDPIYALRIPTDAETHPFRGGQVDVRPVPVPDAYRDLHTTKTYGIDGWPKPGPMMTPWTTRSTPDL